MKIKTLKNFVLLKILDEEKKTNTGIILVKTNDKKDSDRGKVMEIGKDVSENIKVGDVVIFSLSTTTIENNKDTYVIVREEDILAIIN